MAALFQSPVLLMVTLGKHVIAIRVSLFVVQLIKKNNTTILVGLVRTVKQFTPPIFQTAIAARSHYDPSSAERDVHDEIRGLNFAHVLRTTVVFHSQRHMALGLEIDRVVYMNAPKEWLYLKVKLPPKYYDVHPSISLDDIINNASAWQIEVLDDPAFEAMRKERDELRDLIHDEDGYIASQNALIKERDQLRAEVEYYKSHHLTPLIPTIEMLKDKYDGQSRLLAECEKALERINHAVANAWEWQVSDPEDSEMDRDQQIGNWCEKACDEIKSITAKLQALKGGGDDT